MGSWRSQGSGDVVDEPAGAGRQRSRRFLHDARRMLRETRAAAAVEFAMIGLPFLALVGAIFEAALAFLASQILDTAVADASRLIRTGQAQHASYQEADFRAKVCDGLYVMFDCNGLTIDAKAFDTFAAAQSALDSSNVIDDDKEFDTKNFSFQMGEAKQIVVVRVFYQYPLYFNSLGLNLASLSNGKLLMAGVAVFRNEPFPW